MTYAERQELNALSKELFGKPSRWRKMLERGERKADDLTNSQKYNSKHAKVRMTTVTPYTYETLKAYLLNIQAQRQELLEKMKKSTDEKVRETASSTDGN